MEKGVWLTWTFCLEANSTRVVQMAVSSARHSVSDYTNFSLSFPLLYVYNFHILFIQLECSNLCSNLCSYLIGALCALCWQVHWEDRIFFFYTFQIVPAQMWIKSTWPWLDTCMWLVGAVMDVDPLNQNCMTGYLCVIGGCSHGCGPSESKLHDWILVCDWWVQSWMWTLWIKIAWLDTCVWLVGAVMDVDPLNQNCKTGYLCVIGGCSHGCGPSESKLHDWILVCDWWVQSWMWTLWIKIAWLDTCVIGGCSHGCGPSESKLHDWILVWLVGAVMDVDPLNQNCMTGYLCDWWVQSWMWTLWIKIAWLDTCVWLVGAVMDVDPLNQNCMTGYLCVIGGCSHGCGPSESKLHDWILVWLVEADMDVDPLNQNCMTGYLCDWWVQSWMWTHWIKIAWLDTCVIGGCSHRCGPSESKLHDWILVWLVGAVMDVDPLNQNCMTGYLWLMWIIWIKSSKLEI